MHDESAIEKEEEPGMENADEKPDGKFTRWLKRLGQKFRRPSAEFKTGTLLQTEAPQQINEAPLPVVGGAEAEPQPEKEKGEWRTDTTDRLDRLEPIGNNRMTTGDRAAAVGVIDDPKRSDIDTRLGESLEDLSTRAMAEQRRIMDDKVTKKGTASSPSLSTPISVRPLVKRTA